MKAIGGYFELELPYREPFHRKAIPLNTARNCLEYILRARKYKKVYIPYYTCDAILQPICKLGVECSFYHVDAQLNVIDIDDLKKDEGFLYTNYYGLKSDEVLRLSKMIGHQLIVDNSQAFYAMPIAGIDTFYSVRKFFGTSDGAYLYTECLLDINLERDYSYNRMVHLLKRIDQNAEAGYSDFQENERSLDNQPIRKMSAFTERLLSSIDYENVKRIRRLNYQYLDSLLHDRNLINLVCHEEDIPMVYPYVCCEGKILKEMLIQHKYFIATYWPTVLDLCKENDYEYILVNNLLALPIDQRVTANDLVLLYDLLR